MIWNIGDSLKTPFLNNRVVEKGAHAHDLQSHTACKVNMPARGLKMVVVVWTEANITFLGTSVNFANRFFDYYFNENLRSPKCQSKASKWPTGYDTLLINN